MVLLGPGVVSLMRDTVEAAAPLDVDPAGVAPLAVRIKHFYDLFAVGLVVTYEYGFHCFASFFFKRFSRPTQMEQ